MREGIGGPQKPPIQPVGDRDPELVGQSRRAGLAGGLYGVNAFDQPGVEAGKKYTQGLLGRPGYEKYRDELAGAARADPALVLG